MKINFSSVKEYDSHVAYEIAPKTQDQAGSRFTVLSCDVADFDDSCLVSSIRGLIHDNLILLTVHNQKLPGKLQIGNKSINQLRLRQLECCVPDTVILDFSFSNVFKKEGKIGLEEIFKQHIAKKLGPSIAIRCSSNLEDGERQSFTGVFDTYLDVANDFAAFKEKVLYSYEKFCSQDHMSKDISGLEVKLAIIVQRMVKTSYSGFLFTEDPMNPPNTWLKIEYWRGEREKSEGFAITLNRESGKRISSSPDENRGALPIVHQEKLHHTANKALEHYGSPQDIEFVFDKNDHLYVVQSRPITAFNYSPHKARLKEQMKLLRIAEENRELYQRDPILSSTNISELFVQAVPLGYSIFKYGFAGTRNLEGGISRGRSKLGYAKLERRDQVKLFYTVGDQARANIIVDALTFRLPSISKTEFLDRFVTYYLEKIRQDPAAAIYPENGLYLQSTDPERWEAIIGEKGDLFRKEYSDFLEKIITDHAPREYSDARAFFRKNERFYRSYLSRDLHNASAHSLKEETKKIMDYFRKKFCPQYVVFARLAFLCTHLSKEHLDRLLTPTIKFSREHILNELLRSIPVEPELKMPNYPHFEQLLKAGKITMWDFLDRFQHLGSLDIHQPRLGEYSINDLQSIFGTNKKYEHGDGRLTIVDARDTGIDPRIASMDLDKDTIFWNLCTLAGKFMALREKAKHELLKILYILKRIILELARIYRFGDLIFYLEYDELLKLEVNNRESYRLLALQRKAYFEACRQFQVQDVISDFKRAPFEENKLVNKKEPGKEYKFIKGKSVFYGQAQGVCLTAKNNEEYLKKLAVCQVENTGPIIGIFKGVELSYFNLGALAGFTTENGGFLSHAATIAREFKIPYITGITFEGFNDGDFVILDTENEQVIY